jgi:hypothetical protein
MSEVLDEAARLNPSDLSQWLRPFRRLLDHLEAAATRQSEGERLNQLPVHQLGLDFGTVVQSDVEESRMSFCGVWQMNTVHHLQMLAREQVVVTGGAGFIGSSIRAGASSNVKHGWLLLMTSPRPMRGIFRSGTPVWK